MNMEAMTTLMRVAPAYGDGHEKQSVSSSPSQPAYVAQTERGS